MSIRFVNPLPLVADITRARDFYRDVIGLVVVDETDDFVRFDGGFALHDGASLLRQALNVMPDGQPYGRQNLVLYFETDNLDAAYLRIAPKAAVIHAVVRQHWGGRVFRVYDCDGHIVEMGEP